MNNTKVRQSNDREITMTMGNFVAYIGAGYHTANKIAQQAEAKIYIGRRLLININKVQKYLDEISE